MREGNLFNGSYFFSNYKIKNFRSKEFYGLNLYFIKNFEKRFEVFEKYALNHYQKSTWLGVLKYVYVIIPKKKNIKKKVFLNIFFLDILATYRGWRHSRGLPVRGQRTWSNSWSSYKVNTTLRAYKINLLRRLYSRAPVNCLEIACAAEYFNLLWKIQWEKEWRIIRRRRIKKERKMYKKKKIEILQIASGRLNLVNKKPTGKKNKNKNKDLFLFGFDPGFTKTYLNESVEKKLTKRQRRRQKKKK